MPTVRVPSPLRRLTGGRAEVEVVGDDVRGVLADLEARYPGIAERLLDGDGHLRGFVHLFVDDDDVGSRLDTPVPSEAIVSVVPAVAGGA